MRWSTRKPLSRPEPAAPTDIRAPFPFQPLRAGTGKALFVFVSPKSRGLAQGPRSKPSFGFAARLLQKAGSADQLKGHADRPLRGGAPGQAEHRLRCALRCQSLLGAKCVGSESSCRDLTEEEKAATLPLLTDSVLRIVEQAAKEDGCFALEPVFVHTLGTLEALRRLKETVADPKHFHIILDPVNLLTAETAARQDAFWPGWCEVIGRDLACVHVKDARFVPNAPRIPTALGEGEMDYTIIRSWLHREYPDAVLLRDEAIMPAARADLEYMKKM